MKTNYMIVGTQRGGATTLNRCLAQHPLLCVAPQSDTGFFSQDALFQRGTPRYDRYHARFGIGSQHDITVESSSDYLYWQECIPRIYRYNKDVKLIALLRNPIDRAYSQWQATYRSGIEDQSFVDAINLETYRLRTQGDRGQHRCYGYIDRGLYSTQIEQMLQYFDPSQLLFIKSEDLRDHTPVVLYRVFDFIGVPYIEVDEAAQNVGNYDQSMSATVRNEMIELFRRDIARVEELLGWDCSDWLKPTQVTSYQSAIAR